MENPHLDSPNMEKTTQINTNKQNTKKQIDKDDKKILNDSKHHYLTEELIKNKYITCDDSQVFIMINCLNS